MEMILSICFNMVLSAQNAKFKDVRLAILQTLVQDVKKDYFGMHYRTRKDTAKLAKRTARFATRRRNARSATRRHT